MARAVIVVFVQPGCPACAAFKPKLAKVARDFPDVQTITISAADPSPQAQGLADRLQVGVTPTIYALREPAGQIKREGDISERELRSLYEEARQVNRWG
jgi:thiol-disulfide isomerase/thioredoxin